jgi:hypothetical protein
MACAIALLLLTSTIFAQSNAATSDTKSKLAEEIQDREVALSDATYCPRTHALEGAPEEEYWLMGTIRNSTVRMYLHRAGADVVGLFYATEGDWTPTFLGGEWSAKGIKLLGESADEVPTGRLDIQLVNGAFIGRWKSDQSDHADQVRLATTKKPACDGRGVWKRFDDPKWPVSFSYPASWHVKEYTDSNSDVLELICPDPEKMTYSFGVTIFEGKGKPGGPWELVQCPKGWRFGPSCDSYDENAATAQAAKLSQQPDKTVLGLVHEWRVYCSDGGYRGQTEGDDEVVILRNSWAEFMGSVSGSGFVDRLAKSAHVRSEPNAK